MLAGRNVHPNVNPVAAMVVAWTTPPSYVIPKLNPITPHALSMRSGTLMLALCTTEALVGRLTIRACGGQVAVDDCAAPI